MTRRFLWPIVAALTMAVLPAMAAQLSGFDQAIVKHAKDAKAADAKTLRTDGGKLCTSGKTTDGTKKLQQALNDIGVKPTY